MAFGHSNGNLQYVRGRCRIFFPAEFRPIKKDGFYSPKPRCIGGLLGPRPLDLRSRASLDGGCLACNCRRVGPGASTLGWPQCNSKVLLRLPLSVLGLPLPTLGLSLAKLGLSWPQRYPTGGSPSRPAQHAYVYMRLKINQTDSR